MWNQHVEKSLLLSEFSVIERYAKSSEVCEFVGSDNVNFDVQIFSFSRRGVKSSRLGYYLTSARNW